MSPGCRIQGKTLRICSVPVTYGRALAPWRGDFREARHVAGRLILHIDALAS